MTNTLILSLLVSTNATFHWDRSPDPTVTGYVMYASSASRFITERRAAQQTLPTLPGMPTQTFVFMRNYYVATNENWRASCTTNTIGNITNWTVSADNVPSYYAVAARDSAGVESDLSNEVLFSPRWAFVNFCMEGSGDLKNWEVLGKTNVFRFWAGYLSSGNIPAFFRGRLVITNK